MMLVNHGKMESSDGFFGGSFWGAGSSPSNSPSAAGMRAGDVGLDMSGVSRVNLIGRVGSGDGADCLED